MKGIVIELDSPHITQSGIEFIPIGVLSLKFSNHGLSDLISNSLFKRIIRTPDTPKSTPVIPEQSPYPLTLPQDNLIDQPSVNDISAKEVTAKEVISRFRCLYPTLSNIIRKISVEKTGKPFTRKITAYYEHKTVMYLMNVSVWFNTQNEPFCCCTFSNVDSVSKQNLALLHDSDLYQDLLAKTDDIVCDIDVDDNGVNLMNVHHPNQKLVPHRTERRTIYVHPATSLIYAADRQRTIRAIKDAAQHHVGGTCDCRLLIESDDPQWYRMSFHPLDSASDHTHYVCLMREIAGEQKLRSALISEHMKRLHYAHTSEIDSMTGLLNRRGLGRTLDSLLKNERGHAAVLLLDLDNFKLVNDLYGHQKGDALLAEISRRLRSICRPTDILARLGGDEFVVVLPGITKQSVAIQSAQRIIHMLEGVSKQLDIDKASLNVSIGIALFPANGRTRPLLYKAADDALYAAKYKGKGTYSVAPIEA
jgi:diguanylate cyclase (GGDEF)-like protein